MKDNDKENDAALVDSYFLPGGLFADESNNNSNHNERNITSNSYDMRIDSIPTAAAAATATISQSSVSNPLPKNPWETMNPPTTIAAQTMDSTTTTPLSARMNTHTSQYTQPLHLLLPSTQNNGHEMNHLKVDSSRSSSDNNCASDNRANHCDGFGMGTTIIENAVFDQNRNQLFTHRNRNKEGNAEGYTTTNGCMNDTEKMLRPPPGFQNIESFNRSTTDATTFIPNLSHQQNQTIVNNDCKQNSLQFSKRKNATAGNKYSLQESKDGCRDVATGEKGWEATDDSKNAPFLMPNLLHHATNTSPVDGTTYPQKVSLPSDNDTQPIKDSRKQQKQLHAPVSGESNNYEQGGLFANNNNERMRHVRKPLLAEPDSDRNRKLQRGAHQDLVSLISSESKETSLKSIEDDYDDDDGDDIDEDELHEDDMEDNSIPSNICGSSCIESNTSSLSTFSEADNNSDLSSYVSGDIHNNKNIDFKDEGIGYDTDQAHVSRIVGIMGNSMCSAAGNDVVSDEEESSSPDPSSEYSEGQTCRAISRSTKLHNSPDENEADSFWQNLLPYLRSLVEYFAESCHGVINPAKSAMRGSSVFEMARERLERLSRQQEKLSQEFDKIINWLLDVEEVFTALLLRLRNVIRKAFWEGTKAFIVLSSFLFEMLKFAVIEAIEEFNGVTTCYIAFYLLPAICVLLMDYINLPHWTPHISTWMAIYSRCYLVEAGTLLASTDISVFRLFVKFVKALASISTAAPSKENPPELSSTTMTTHRNLVPHRENRGEVYKTRDEHVCYIALKVLKTMVPAFFVVEGFSSEFGSIIGVKSTNRLITAYNMVLVRKCLIKSPIGWISWSIQVLMATYCSSWVLLDYLILLIGFSSIRLIRYLDAHQLQRKQSAKYS
eukprot:CAMPEP_0168304626 /NCGR_PEP_ID=MMETSP0142_2-20121227/47413_1 /TAXON_ID=44445 /ORGANISM="Pseudo-nitzschia australis, Strain 10249 10 AB" /LENGTH=889 /DNA_ID=CAMNT_0008255895 /DNA_START=494 /DNA_END=3160 /DNA_ORIENTATION=+